MIEIIPAILTDSEEELIRLVGLLEAAGVERVHLDICDGQFVPTTTIKGYEELSRLDTSIKFDIHLMTQDPEHYVDHWAMAPQADRFIVHVEATDMMPTLADHCHGHGHKIIAAKNPDTPLGKLSGLQCELDGAMFMTVQPGKQGNPFVPGVLDDIRTFAAEHGDLPIMVDGGITPETASQCALAGATSLVSGSYIVQSSDINAAMSALKAAVVK